jgi:hypothetical protein
MPKKRRPTLIVPLDFGASPFHRGVAASAAQWPDGREWFVPLTCERKELMALARRTMIEEGAVLGMFASSAGPCFARKPVVVGDVIASAHGFCGSIRGT